MRVTNRERLGEQCADDARLAIRQETHCELLTRVDELIRQRIAIDGEFRIPKRVVCYVATSM